MLGPDVMVFVKKLRLLQRKGDEISRDRAVEKTRKYVVSIGEAISDIVRQHPSRALRLEQSLWDVSALFTHPSLAWSRFVVHRACRPFCCRALVFC